jgi:hypothetical protein
LFNSTKKKIPDKKIVGYQPKTKPVGATGMFPKVVKLHLP